MSYTLIAGSFQQPPALPLGAFRILVAFTEATTCRANQSPEPCEKATARMSSVGSIAQRSC